MSTLLRNPWLLTLCFVGVVFPAAAKDFEREANQLFDKRFSENKIEGTGHVFGIVVDCDSKRLKNMADQLPKDRMQILEYEFTFKINTLMKSLAGIIGGGLEKSVEQCIIDKYYKDVTFASGSWMRPVMEDTIRFPAVLVKGKEPIVPRTSIGFVTYEK
jgi:hypothetical protein